MKQERMQEILWEETKVELKRYTPGNLKLGRNKSKPHVGIGGVVMTELGGKPPCMGVVVATTQRDAQVRFRRGTRTVPIGQCVPIADRDNMDSESRIGNEFSHFISAEFDKECEEFEMFAVKVKGMQNILGNITGMGKPVKPHSLHVTLAVLHVETEEVAGLIEETKKVWEEYVSLIGYDCLALSFKGITFGDNGTIFIKMELGKDVMMMLREMLESKIGKFLTDLRFEPHLTVFRSSIISDELKQGLKGSASLLNLGCVNVKKISIRSRKIGKTLSEPVVSLAFREEESAE